jgi:phospholipid N-methyltransferase
MLKGPTELLNGTASRSQQAWLFAQNFIKHPKMIGSFIPSSRYLVERLLGEINWSKKKVVVEYGPGVGTFTRELLTRMPADGTLIAIEMNRDFAAYLRVTIRDPRFHVVQGSAADVRDILWSRGIKAADCVVSGIPCSTLPPEVRAKVLSETREVLADDGEFLVYQFTRTVLPQLREVFGVVRTEFEPLNILPAQLFFCSR